jgi:23S rRNA pseudouridine2605 synthase
MATLLRVVIDATGFSRRSAFAAIREGRVTVDGEAVRDPSGEYVSGLLAIDGALLGRPSRQKTYLLLHKPPGYVTTVSDEMGRKTVLDLVPAMLRVPGLHPVGRLDRDTSGLLILTNDGGLTYRLTHPKHEVDKEYWLGLAQPLSESQLAALRRGIEIDGAVRRPLALARLTDAGPFELSMTVGEGRKRQVRRMVEVVGGRLRRLRRVREGPLWLGELAEGAVRRLTAPEVRELMGEGGGRARG